MLILFLFSTGCSIYKSKVRKNEIKKKPSFECKIILSSCYFCPMIRRGLAAGITPAEYGAVLSVAAMVIKYERPKQKQQQKNVLTRFHSLVLLSHYRLISGLHSRALSATSPFSELLIILVRGRRMMRTERKDFFY